MSMAIPSVIFATVVKLIRPKYGRGFRFQANMRLLGLISIAIMSYGTENVGYVKQ